jgi:Holliday junction resolvase
VSAANKAKGTKFERDIAEYLQGQGYDAKRLPRTGVKDIGDVGLTLLTDQGGVGGTPFTLVIEAKDRAALDWPTFLAEADVEAGNYSDKYPRDGWTVPVVVAKRRRQGIHRSYVMFELDSFVELLRGLGL